MVEVGRWYQDKFHLSWYDDSKMIFVISYEKSYGWADYYEMMNVVAEMIEGVIHPIVYVNQWHNGVQMPTENPLRHYQNMDRIFDPQAMILIMQDKVQINMTRIYLQASGFCENKDYWFSDTYENGITIAHEQVQRLAKQPASLCIG